MYNMKICIHGPIFSECCKVKKGATSKKEVGERRRRNILDWKHQKQPSRSQTADEADLFMMLSRVLRTMFVCLERLRYFNILYFCYNCMVGTRTSVT